MSRAGEGDSEARDGNRSTPAKGKSCKGTLYYSSILKSQGRSPRCVGLSSINPRVSGLAAGESEAEATKNGRNLTDFKYTCVGYSVYSDNKGASDGARKPGAQLPVCFGIELLVDKRPADGSALAHAHGSASARAHGSEDGGELPLPRPNRPPPRPKDEFLNRLTRNAGVVASGVVKNARRTGNHIAKNARRVGKDIINHIGDVIDPRRPR